jgi:hypothetical protein
MDDREVLDLIAVVYEQAQASGRSTSGAVADLLECSVATADVWIARSKDEGVLKLSMPRRRRRRLADA